MLALSFARSCPGMDPGEQRGNGIRRKEEEEVWAALEWRHLTLANATKLAQPEARSLTYRDLIGKLAAKSSIYIYTLSAVKRLNEFARPSANKKSTLTNFP